jgi:hypothetical protein
MKTLVNIDRAMETPCNYFDYEKKTLEQWRTHLENSEVNNYTFVYENVAINDLEHGTAIKKYENNTVYSWFEHN